MPIILRLDVMMARRKVRSNVLARAIGISETNLSLLRSGKVRGLRFTTLDAICRYLDCDPADLLEYQPDAEPVTRPNVAEEPRPRRARG